LTPATRLTALDGLRAIAVTLVIADHSLALGAKDHQAFEPFHPGSFGVRLFFVLSGYLITAILIHARTDAEAAGWPLRRVLLAFYVRRSLRIFPVAYLCILVAWLIGDSSVTRHWAWYLTYTQNILIAEVGWRGQLTHFWSLAVEEQFYLLWPVMALWLPRRFAVPVLVFGFLAVGAARAALAARGEWIDAYVLLWTRGDALAFGGLLALLPGMRVVYLLASGAVLVGFGAIVESATHALVSEWGLILISAALIVATLNGRAGWILRWRPLVYLGTISYGIYIWHTMADLPVLQIERALNVSLGWPDELGWAQFAYRTAASVAIASLSWFVLEKPINDLKTRVPYVRRTTEDFASTAAQPQ
jgi:peptidoglycan/LPS O-acetylase OafA/YrhL